MAIIEQHVCSKNKNGNGARYQDKMYGNGRRVANKTKSGYRCVVCGELITVPKIIFGK